VHATDPEAISRAKSVVPQITYHDDIYETLRDAEAVLICTEWDEFRNLDWEKAGKLMARRLVIDGRNICSPQRMRELDFEYFSFGREEVRAAAQQAAR
jgi:UDPglucose 6-dehydrogenase